MGFARCVLGCLVWAANFLVRSALHQHLQNFFLAVVRSPRQPERCVRATAHAFNEHGKTRREHQTEPWLRPVSHARNHRRCAAST